MYTVLWQEAGCDKWDRLESKEEVVELLLELKKNEDVCLGDVWIFTPEADDYAEEYFSFIDNEDNFEGDEVDD